MDWIPRSDVSAFAGQELALPGNQDLRRR